MKVNRTSWLLLAAISLSLASFGCAKKAEEMPNEGGSAPASTSSTTTPTGEPVVYKNDKGVALCPVMNVEIEDVSKAKGYQDHKGVRYYFCCDMCPPKFKENPDLYAKK